MAALGDPRIALTSFLANKQDPLHEIILTISSRLNVEIKSDERLLHFKQISCTYLRFNRMYYDQDHYTNLPSKSRSIG